jgi:hypothetical protein
MVHQVACRKGGGKEGGLRLLLRDDGSYKLSEGERDGEEKLSCLRNNALFVCQSEELYIYNNSPPSPSLKHILKDATPDVILVTSRTTKK